MSCYVGKRGYKAIWADAKEAVHGC